jgi:hypothetical protein
MIDRWDIGSVLFVCAIGATRPWRGVGVRGVPAWHS